MFFRTGLRFSRQHSAEYKPLSHLSKDSIDSEETSLEDLSKDLDSSPRKKVDSISWAVIVCIFCTIVNIWLSTSSSGQSNYEPVSRKELGRLRRPNQFIGLDKVKRPIPPIPRKFINYPTLLKQISRSEPKKVFDDDPRRHRTWRGTVSPDDRSVNITTTLSTIAEFRAIDYGMEHCELALRVPRAYETSTTIDSSLTLGDNLNSVDLWRLKITYPVDSLVLSWSNRPQRVEKLATYNIEYDRTYTYSFNCTSDSLHLFEFAGSSADCKVEWWQDREDPSPGLFITQYATK